MPSNDVVGSSQRWGGRAGLCFVFVIGVCVWWLLMAAGVALTLPAPAGAVPKGAAHVSLPGQVSAHPALPIPVERVAFDEAQRGYRESDEEAIDHAYTVYEWIEVSHGQAVRIVTHDGEAVEVELLEGRYSGRRGWLRARQLAP